jgi:hypothetical protein
MDALDTAAEKSLHRVLNDLIVDAYRTRPKTVAAELAEIVGTILVDDWSMLFNAVRSYRQAMGDPCSDDTLDVYAHVRVTELIASDYFEGYE